MRSRSSAETSLFSAASSPIRQLRHCLLKTLNSYLSHVQPASMIRGVVKLQAFGYTTRFGRLKRFVERSELVGVEIVQHQTTPGEGRPHQPASASDERSPQQCDARSDMPPPALGFAEHEQVAGAVSLILGVIAFHTSGPRLNCRSHILDQLLGCLIETDHWTVWVMVLVVQVQHILHPSHELPTHFGNAPLLPLPRLEFVFFSIWRTVSGEMLSENPIATTLPASSRSDHRVCPSGAALQWLQGALPAYRSACASVPVEVAH